MHRSCCSPSQFMCSESFPPWDADITIGSHYRICISAFFQDGAHAQGYMHIPKSCILLSKGVSIMLPLAFRLCFSDKCC